ncbi:MAG: elongation factor G [Candidatus Eremiobacteraeota bacterium]|nr:elongation factor G [Candidatus Eremiobacteraeota bacterium]
MKRYDTAHIRNVGLFGHGSSGKTTLTEAMLFDTKAIDRFGKVTAGSTTSDFDPDEIRKGISLFTTVLPVEYRDMKLNILDSPGFLDFVSQVKSAMRVVESGLFLVSAVGGVEVGLERVWKFSCETNIARAFFINMMDKENADFDKCIDEINKDLKVDGELIPLQLPIGRGDSFIGVVDLLKKSAYAFEDGKPIEIDIPEDMEDIVEEYVEKIAEAAAGDDEKLMEKFFEGELTPEDITRSLLGEITEGRVIPVLCGSSDKNIGITNLMDFIIDFLPDPGHFKEIKGLKPETEEEILIHPDPSEPVSALVFKTTTDPYVGKLSVLRVYSGTLKPDIELLNPGKETNEKISSLMIFRGKDHEVIDQASPGDIVTLAKLSVTGTSDTLCDKSRPVEIPRIDFPDPLMSMSVYPKSKSDEDKLGNALSKILEEDPTIKVNRDKMTKETVIYGIGELHLNIVMERLKRKFGLEADLKTPKIPYKETLKSKTQIEHKYKKQSGGRGQYGHVYLELEPLPRDQEFEFVDKIVGGVIPKNFIPSVEKGVKRAMEEGFLAGFPVTSVRVKLFDGSYHTVDSSDIAFQIAASMAFKKGAHKATPILLEPIMDVEVVVPESFMGDCIGDLNSKRGRILGMDPLGDGMQSIKAKVPLSEMLRYSIDLRSLTQGKGEFAMKFSFYEEVPSQIAEPIIAEANKSDE